MIFTNDSMLMSGFLCHKRLIDSSEERTDLIVPWNLNHFLFAYDVIIFLFLLNVKYELMFYKIPELLIIWVSFQAIV